MSFHPKLLINQYYNGVINQIDIEIESRILNNENSCDGNFLNFIRNDFIDKIKIVEKRNYINLSKINGYLLELESKGSSADIENIESCLFEEDFCFFLKSKTRHNNQEMPILVICDFYLDPDQINSVKKSSIFLKISYSS